MPTYTKTIQKKQARNQKYRQNKRQIRLCPGCLKQKKAILKEKNKRNRRFVYLFKPKNLQKKEKFAKKLSQKGDYSQIWSII